ncbi:MAG: hypothetical protein CME71_07390 [Halobacteriovorax sp.]|nr:hypothetical protein [Halobacteriovorax sp.]
MKTLTVFFTFLLCAQTMATPTAEGLFRNVSNKEPTGNLIVVTAMVEEMEESAPAAESTPNTASLNEALMPPTKKKPIYYKWLLSLEREGSVDMIQVSYRNSQLKEEQIVQTKYFPDIAKVVSNDNSLERSMYYSLMNMLVVNESKMFKALLVKYAQGFQSNKELMTKEKVALYRKYKEYLEKRQEDETLISPLEPTDPDQLSAVKEIMAAPMYKDAGNVELVRIDNELAWKVDLKSLNAIFSNEDHRLRKIEYQSPLGDLRVITDEYVLFNGAHELPKTMIFKDMSNKSWRVRFLGLSHLNTHSTPFTKRAQDYTDAAKKAREMRKSSAQGQEDYLNPPFIF